MIARHATATDWHGRHDAAPPGRVPVSPVDAPSPPTGGAAPSRVERRLVAGGHDWHLDITLAPRQPAPAAGAAPAAEVGANAAEATVRPLCLMLHGTGASAASCSALAERLASHPTRGFDVVAPDLPAHARTRSPASAPLDIDAHAEALDRLIDALSAKVPEAEGRRPALLVGHSAGSVALAAWLLRRLAKDASDTLPPLIAINGAMLPLEGPAGWLFEPLARVGSTLGWLPRLFALRAAREPDHVRRLLGSTGSRVDDTMVARYTPLLADSRHVAGVLRMMASWQLGRFAPRLSGLRVPVHLIASDRDRTIPLRQAHRLSALLPDATLDVLPGLGHLAHEEAPDTVADTIFGRIAAATRAPTSPGDSS